MERWKELPPITLDNTTVPYLVTLIPVLVSMTSKDEMPQEPRFENETDKPLWWPRDVQWQNPKCFMQDHLEKEERLLILRKLVHSCYSYHGVEDLLCCLDEMPSPETAEEGLEVIELTEEDKLDGSTTDCDGPVFVCCFCLEQFTSHEDVNSHQSICKNSMKESGSISPDMISANNSKEQQNSLNPASVKSFLGPEEPSDSRASEASDFLDTILCSGVSSIPTSPVKSMADHSKLGSYQPAPVSLLAAQPQSNNQSPPLKQQQPQVKVAPVNKPVRKTMPAPSDPYPFVPTLKTRSQKKLDQIMLKHNLKKMMLKECEEMQAVPKKGAWWRSRKSNRTVVPARHPITYSSQVTFCSSLGLARTKDVKREDKDKEQQEVDLDCQIIMVEGPLSTVQGSQPESNSTQQATTSPRASKSLMSQLCRDAEESGRRRLSFRFLEDEWADKEALEEGRDPQQMSLLSIEFSSPLGVRIRKYMSGEGQLNIVKDPEIFCKTEDMDDSYSKLRMRANDYRVTFRKKRRATRFVHKYKFNKSDRQEFKMLLQTGLSARSRKLQRQLNSCIVSLKRMQASEIKEWTEGKKIIISERIVVDDDICITQVDIPESQMKKALSHERTLAARYKPGPKCFGGLGRRHSATTLNRPPIAPYGAPSPPHVPNIFRNRNSHTPSPPRFGSLNRAAPIASLNGHPLTANTRSDGQDLVSSQGWCAERSRPPQVSHNASGYAHLSQHRIMSPSPFVHERAGSLQPNAAHTSSSTSNQVFTGHNSPNRRKQQLTHVRCEETDSSFKPLQSHENPFRRRPPAESVVSHQVPKTASNINGQHMRNSSSSSSSAAAMIGRKLSNFDHFSIRNGKVSPSSSVSQGQQQSLGHHSALSRSQPHLGQRSRPLPDWGNVQQSVRTGPGVSRTNQPGPNPIRPGSVIQSPHNKSQQERQNSGISRSPVRSSQKFSKPGLKQQQAQLQCTKEDDVMEVICIDDD